MHCALLIAALALAVVGWERGFPRVLLPLALLPLTRILNLTLPLVHVPTIAWYLGIDVLLLQAAILIKRRLGYSWSQLGQRVRELPLQILVALAGVGIGVLHYVLLRPSPLLEVAESQPLIVVSLAVLISTGLVETVVFFGVMLHVMQDGVGPAAVWLVGAGIAALSVGWMPWPHVAIVLVVGWLHAWVAHRTGCLLGVALGRGLSHVICYLVLPLLY